MRIDQVEYPCMRQGQALIVRLCSPRSSSSRDLPGLQAVEAATERSPNHPNRSGHLE